MTEDKINTLADSFFKRMRLPEEIRADEDEREIMRELIRSGAEYLSAEALGLCIDFERDHIGRDLLYNYCFYGRADSTEQFESAYRARLIELRNRAVAGKVITEDTNAQD